MMSCWASSRTCEAYRTMPHGAESQGGLNADWHSLSSVSTNLIRHSPELGITGTVLLLTYWKTALTYAPFNCSWDITI